MKLSILPAARRKEIVVQEVDGEILIYDLLDNKALCLNKTSALVWSMCDGTNSVERLAAKLGEKLEQPIENEMILLTLEELRKKGLIEDQNEDLLELSGLTRREVIQKIGFTSLVALPVVSLIVAPSSASAQSCLAPGTPTGSTMAADCSEFNALCCNGAAVPVFVAGNTRACRCDPSI
ncbi:MAG: PqqD family protein [Pyrinomonadaceae bacterium]